RSGGGGGDHLRRDQPPRAVAALLDGFCESVLRADPSASLRSAPPLRSRGGPPGPLSLLPPSSFPPPFVISTDFVIPAKAGTQRVVAQSLDPRFRGDDEVPASLSRG